MAEPELAQARDQEAAEADDVIATLVELTRTGPLALGTFTTAQILAVNGPAPGLPVPEPAVLAEAVRGLVARGMAVPVTAATRSTSRETSASCSRSSTAAAF